MTRLITLTTDFGLVDGFVGVMRGVILSIAPDANIVDITHGIAPQQVQEGAFLLANSTPYFPPQAVHVCVVDPGVGSARRGLAIEVGETTFVGPDNGVLSLAVQEFESRSGYTARAVVLENSNYWLPRVSNTFHGRDVFSPTAAHLARGVPLEALGTPVQDWTRLSLPAPARKPNGELDGQVIYIDHYGNVVTNIGEQELRGAEGKQLVVELGGRQIRGVTRTYSDAPRGEFIALIGSPWKLEVAVREGSAAQQLRVRVGDRVRVWWSD